MLTPDDVNYISWQVSDKSGFSHYMFQARMAAKFHTPVTKSGTAASVQSARSTFIVSNQCQLLATGMLRHPSRIQLRARADRVALPFTRSAGMASRLRS